MKFNYPDPDTGYYEDEASYLAYDRELELAAQNREDRLEWEAEEMQSKLWDGERLLAQRPEGVDPETGCTAAEMKEEEIDGVTPRQSCERRVA